MKEFTPQRKSVQPVIKAERRRAAMRSGLTQVRNIIGGTLLAAGCYFALVVVLI